MARSSRPAALIRGARTKPTVPGIQPPLGRAAADLHQRPRPVVGSPAMPGQAVAHHDPVLAGERHDVGDRRQRHQSHRPDEVIAQVGRGRLPSPKLLQTCQASLNATPAPQRSPQGYEPPGSRGWTITAASRQIRADRMVVGHDQLDAQFARQLGLAKRRDPAIHRHDQRGRIFGRQPPQGLGIDAVALLDPVRDVIAGVAAPASFRHAQRMLVPHTPSTS